MDANEQALDPNEMHRIDGCSPSTVTMLAALLEVSSEPVHWLYREAELDDLWRHAKMDCQRARESEPDQSTAYHALHEAAFEAHDLTAEGRTREAAHCLRAASAAFRDGGSA